MKSDRLALVPPFLVAAYPVIGLCAKNADRLTLYEMVRPLLVSMLVAAILVGLSQLALRNRAKCGLYSSLLLAAMYSFGGLRSAVQRLVPALTTTNVYQLRASMAALALCIGIAAAVFYVLRRTQRDLHLLTRYLAILAAVLLVIPLFSIARYEMVKTSRPESMARWDAEIARQCRSLASSLNGDYLSDLDKYASIDSAANLNYMIRDNRVARLLKSLGYKYVLMSSGWEVSANSDLADVVLPKSAIKITEMERVLIKKSVFGIWWKDSVPYLRSYVMSCFEDMAELPRMKGPKFVFAHIVCPHEPWLFDREGNEPDNPATPERPAGWRTNYTDQVCYINTRVERLVDRILATSKTPPIIILQGDHGAFDPEFYTRWWTGKAVSPSNDEIAEGFRPRISILNAYYLPGKARKALYSSISPVNTFRVVLDRYFGYHLKLLADVSYIPKQGQCRNEMSPRALRKYKP